MVSYEEKMGEVSETLDVMEKTIKFFNQGIYEYVSSLWISLFSLQGILHEYCNMIEEGNFNQEEFYNQVSEMLGRPKEL